MEMPSRRPSPVATRRTSHQNDPRNPLFPPVTTGLSITAPYPVHKKRTDAQWGVPEAPAHFPKPLTSTRIDALTDPSLAEKQRRRTDRQVYKLPSGFNKSIAGDNDPSVSSDRQNDAALHRFGPAEPPTVNTDLRRESSTLPPDNIALYSNAGSRATSPTGSEYSRDSGGRGSSATVCTTIYAPLPASTRPPRNFSRPGR